VSQAKGGIKGKKGNWKRATENWPFFYIAVIQFVALFIVAHFSVAQISGCHFYRSYIDVAFIPMPHFSVAQFSHCPIFRCPFSCCPIFCRLFSLLFLP